MKSHHPPDTPSKPSREFVPSERWIEKFERECTEALLRRARSYAARYAQDVGWNLPSASAHDPGDVVSNIVKDTLSGALRWNHETEELGQHLFDAIRSRVACHAETSKRYRHESIDATDSDGTSSMMSEVEAQLEAAAEEATIDTRERAAESLRSLRYLAGRNPLVLRLITAFENGATDLVADLRASEHDWRGDLRASAREFELCRAQLSDRVAAAGRGDGRRDVRSLHWDPPGWSTDGGARQSLGQPQLALARSLHRGLLYRKA